MDALAKATKQEHRKVKLCSCTFILFTESFPGYNIYTLIVISSLGE